MRRILATVTTTLVLAGGLLAPAAPASAVTDTVDATVAAVAHPVATIPTFVRQIDVAGATARLVASGTSVFSVQADRDVEIDSESLQARRLYVLSSTAMAVSGDLMFYDDAAGNLYALDTKAQVIVGVGHTAPSSPAIAATGSTVLVANPAKNRVDLFKLGGGNLVNMGTVPVGQGPVAIALSPDGKTAYVVNQLSNTVSVIGISNNVGTVAGTVVVDSGPSAIAADDTGVYVLHPVSESVTVIDPATLTVRDTIALPAGCQPSALAISATALYIAEERDNALLVIDRASNTVAGSVPLGYSPLAVVTSGSNVFVGGDAPMLTVFGPPRLTASASAVSGATGKPISPITLSAAGFTPTTMSVSSGTLPAGLSLAKGADGAWTISGTPTQVTEATVTVTATDGTSSASTEVTVTTQAPLTQGECAVTKPAGLGTDENPIVISTLGELVWLVNSPSAWSQSIRQTADIDLVNCTWLQGIGTKTLPFTGVYNGQGHVIKHLTRMSVAPGVAVGMFDYVKGATLQSVILEDAKISGVDRVGGLVGNAISSRIKASSTSGTLKGAIGGGLVGAGTGVSIVNSYSRMALTATGSDGATLGGLAGLLDAKSTIANSYALARLNGTSLSHVGPLVGQPDGASQQDSVRNLSSTGQDTFTNTLGLERTQAQMRDISTYLELDWKIANMSARGVPWAICAGVNDGYPFLSARFLANPCPTLIASATSVDATAGTRIDPITMATERFTPTSFAISAGTLPAGLVFDKATGSITGTPTAKAARRTLVISAIDGSIVLKTSLKIEVAPKARLIGAIEENPNCTYVKTKKTVTVTCNDPGTYTIKRPPNTVLASTQVLGADGGKYAHTSNRWHGVGAQVSLPNLQDTSTAQAPEYVVTVGQRGTSESDKAKLAGISSVVRWLLSLTFDQQTGGGPSAVQLASGSGTPMTPLVVAGGGGGGATSLSMVKRYCDQLAALGIPLQSTDPILNCAHVVDFGTLFGDAGMPGTVTQVTSSVTSQAGAGNYFVGFSQAGSAGVTAVDGGTVTPRPANGQELRNGQVRLVFALSDAVGQGIDTTQCDNATPKLGELVTCSTPGLASVTVPGDATIARIEAAGAGGGAGGTASSTWYDGEGGAATRAIVDVDGIDTLRARVGEAGKSLLYSNSGLAPFTWYGQGGGASQVVTDDGTTSLVAGGGGGANGFSANYDEISTNRAAGSAWVQSQVSGQTITVTGATAWPVPTTAVAQGANAGTQGASAWLGSTLSDPVYEPERGAAGGKVVLGWARIWIPVGAKDGYVKLRFCGLPDAPSVTSVLPGGTAGQATADVKATQGNDGGCAPDQYQFRTSATSEWVKAPSLDFSIVYDLVSGQSVCVQMRAHNDAGWSGPSDFTCGNARNTNADLSASGSGGGGGGTVTITFTTAGTGSPTSIAVGVGGTFYIQNDNPTNDQAYVRDGAQSGGAGNIHSATAACTSSTQNVCFLANGLNGPYTVDALGDIFIYNPGHGPGQTVALN